MRVEVTPEEMRRFCANLRQFNEQPRYNSARLPGQFRQLGETWCDQDFDKFEGAVRVFAQFSREAEAAGEYLRR